MNVKEAELFYNMEFESNTRALVQETTSAGYVVYNGIDRSKYQKDIVYNAVQAMAREWFFKEFGYYPTIRFEYNANKTKANGQFTRVIDGYSGNTKDMWITLSGRFLQHAHIKYVLKTLKHELVHYHLWGTGKQYADGTPLFESLMVKYELPSNVTRANKCHGYSYKTARYTNTHGIHSKFTMEDLQKRF